MTRLQSLNALSRLWQTHDSHWRTKAVSALQVSTGYSTSDIDAALDSVFAELSPPLLSEFYVKTIKPILGTAAAPRIVLHMAAGNVFTAWLHGVVITLLMGHTCWIKPSSTEPVFARLWMDSLKRVDLELADAVVITPWRDSLAQEVNAVVAYGTDSTIQFLRHKFQQSIFIGYGHKWSFGIVFSEALRETEWPAWRQKIQRDSRAFLLQGCLSPQILFVEGADDHASEISCLSTPAPVVRAFASLDEIQKLLEHSLPDVTCVGIAGPETKMKAVRHRFQNYPSIRFCPMGLMQQPSLAWHNGGLSLVDELRFLNSNI